jgi:hypothetical protein
MSNESSNAPMMSAGSTSIFQTWINALTRPNEQTYSDIAASPNAKATTAYLWVFITSILVNLITFVVEGTTIRERLTQSGLGADRVGNGIVGVLVALICVAPIYSCPRNHGGQRCQSIWLGTSDRVSFNPGLCDYYSSLLYNRRFIISNGARHRECV